MMYDLLTYAQAYEKLHPLFPEAFAYLRQFDPRPGHVARGRHELRGSDLYALVQTYETQPAEKLRFETHQRFIDLQYLVSGREIIYHAHASSLTPDEPYNPDRDLQFYAPSHRQHPERLTQLILLGPGAWTILFPQDAHMPMACVGSPSAVYKVVLKIRV